MKQSYRLFLPIILTLLFAVFINAQNNPKEDLEKLMSSPTSHNIKSTAKPNSIINVQNNVQVFGTGKFLVANQSSINIVDAATGTASGPFFLGQIGNQVLDCAVTPDGKTAIVSDFNSSKLFFIDLTDVNNPVLLGDLLLPIRAEDIDITPDGKYAFVTDGGGFSGVISVDIAARTILQNLGGNYTAVAVSSDGQTVLTANYINKSIDVYLLDSSTGLLSFQNTINLTNGAINVIISPDGKTALSLGDNSPSEILSINAPGQVNLVGFLPSSNNGNQSGVFNKQGTKIYLLGVDRKINIYDVLGIGNVAYSGTSIPLSYVTFVDTYYGVDQMALDGSGNVIYVSNNDNPGFEEVVDLTNNNHSKINTGSNPRGISFIGGNTPPQLGFLPNSRMTAGEQLIIYLQVQNNDNDPLTFQASSNVYSIQPSIVGNQLVINSTDYNSAVATITVTVSDGQYSDTKSFVLIVDAPPIGSLHGDQNEPPTIASIPDQTMKPDSTIRIMVIGRDPEEQQIYYNASSSNNQIQTSFYANLLTITTTADVSTSGTITVGVYDGYNYTTKSFNVSVIVNNKPVIVAGDANGNGSVEAFDATTVMRYVVGLDTYLPVQQKINADEDGDGKITANDAYGILYYLVNGNFPHNSAKAANKNIIK